jgi:hypothetical protein
MAPAKPPNKKNPPGKKPSAGTKSRRQAERVPLVPLVEERKLPRGLGPEAAGQAGDLMGLSRTELAAPESVEELAEEGQAFEAEVIDAVENAPPPEKGPLRVREVPQDDVPREYRDED